MRKTLLRKKIKNRTLKKKMKGGMMAEEGRGGGAEDVEFEDIRKEDKVILTQEEQVREDESQAELRQQLIEEGRKIQAEIEEATEKYGSGISIHYGALNYYLDNFTYPDLNGTYVLDQVGLESAELEEGAAELEEGAAELEEGEGNAGSRGGPEHSLTTRRHRFNVPVPDAFQAPQHFPAPHPFQSFPHFIWKKQDGSVQSKFLVPQLNNLAGVGEGIIELKLVKPYEGSTENILFARTDKKIINTGVFVDDTGVVNVLENGDIYKKNGTKSILTLNSNGNVDIEIDGKIYNTDKLIDNTYLYNINEHPLQSIYIEDI